jgi:hypothetical protein
MNNNYDTQISFFIAEVLDIPNIETYTLKTQRNSVDNLHHVYEIACKIISPDPYSPTIYNIKPADINFKKIPLVGEQVLIFQGYREDSNIDQLNTQQWYYLTTLSVLSNININAITGLSRSGKVDSKPGTSFIEKDVSTLQAYEGDLLVEGRFGNSIRFGSSFDISKAKVDVKPNYLGANGAPIIILSNRSHTTTDLVTENIETDIASLYITSTQNFNTLTTSNPVASTTAVSKFNKSQLIGVADRIVLKAKTESVIVDAKEIIELNAPTVYIGSSDKTDKEPLLHSTAVVSLLQKIVSVLKIGFADSSGAICTELYSIPESDYAKLFKELTNDNILVDKYKKNTVNR